MRGVHGRSWTIADSAEKIEGVKIACVVTGNYDVIVYAEIADMAAFASLVDEIHAIDGVERTHTLVAVPRTFMLPR